MGSVRLDLAYDGGDFRGWAAQPGERTVQGELEGALATLLGVPVGLTVAGRTDAGVHAWGQVASFEVEAAPAPDLAYRLNALTAEDIAIRSAVPAPVGFDARRDARSRTYCYRVHSAAVASPFERGRALWWPGRLDPDGLGACAEAIRGSHDFTAFTPTRTEHVRFERDVLRAEWAGGPSRSPDSGARAPHSGEGGTGEILSFWIEADAFMRSMVRVLVGTMLDVASGRRTPEEFAGLLDGVPREQAGETAPPHGLYLASASY